jgi:nucleotide-binding universal stress UspA family protein
LNQQKEESTTGGCSTLQSFISALLHIIRCESRGYVMTTHYKILYPVDLSSRSVLAAQYIKTWVDRFGAVLHTLHVVDTKALGLAAEYDEPLSDEIRRLIAKRTADLKYFSAHYFGADAAHTTVLSGDRADEIENFANREEIDLIMLPRDHQGSLARLFHDSLTATLLERCTASVWTTEHLDTAPPSPVNSILCAVHLEQDATLDAENHRILQKLQELASTFRARVAFVYVLDGNENRSSRSAAYLQRIAGMKPWMAQARKLFGNSITFVRKSGDVITAITDTAQELAADLIVVGRTRPGTIGLGRQSHILKIDDVVRRPILSVW